MKKILIVLLLLCNVAKAKDSTAFYFSIGSSVVPSCKASLQIPLLPNTIVGFGGGFEIPTHDTKRWTDRTGYFLYPYVLVGSNNFFIGGGYGYESHIEQSYAPRNMVGLKQYNSNQKTTGWTAIVSYAMQQSFGVRLDYSEYRKFGFELIIGLPLSL